MKKIYLLLSLCLFFIIGACDVNAQSIKHIYEGKSAGLSEKERGAVFNNNDTTTRETEIALANAAIVNFREQANYELRHWPKHVRRFIEQGEDREEEAHYPEKSVLPSAINLSKPPEPKLKGDELQWVSPAATITFNGVMDNGTLIPPDIEGAAGPVYVMEVTNQQFIIYTKTGTLNSSVSPSTFFSATGGSKYFDPHVLYDANGGRYIVCMDGTYSNGDGGIFIGVSQTSDPTGSWYVSAFDGIGNQSDFLDFPEIGYNANWIVVTANDFLANGGTTAKIYVLNKASLYSGTASGVSAFTDNSSFSITPAQTIDSGQTTEYLIQDWNGNSGGSGYMNIGTITGTVGSPVYSTGYNIGINAPWSETDIGAPQSGGNTIDDGDTRVSGNVTCVNGSLWFAHTVFLPAASPTHAAVDWWQVNPVYPFSIQQYGRIEDVSASTFYYYPSINVNSGGDALLGYCQSSASTYASATYSFHAAVDASNTMEAGNLYKAGVGNYFKEYGGGRNRWGDFTCTAVDPTNNSFWNFSEWANTGNLWATVIANVAARICSGTPTAGSVAPGSEIICNGSPAILTLTGSTTPIDGMTYQWMSSPDSITFTNIQGATLSSYTTAALAANTFYKCVVSCSSNGSDTTINIAKVSVDAPLATYNVTGGGMYCLGNGGVSVGLSGSQTGVNYQLQLGGTNAGIAVAGTGTAISFGNETLAGAYTVVATLVANGCTASMTGNATVTITPTPVITVAGACGSAVLSCTAGGSLLWSSGAATSSITVTSSGTYSVTATVNGCASIAGTAAVTVTSIPPGTPASLTGNTSGVCNSSNQVYTAGAVTGATAYIWTLPTGVTIVSGQGSTSLTVNYGSGFVSGSGISVNAATNGCAGSAISLSVTATPAVPGTIAGNITPCKGTSGSYSVTPTYGATSYTWTPPTGVTLSGQTTSNVVTASVSATFAGGSLCVKAVNSCGASGTSCITLTPFPTTVPSVTVANGCGSTILSTTAAGSLTWSNGGTTSAITVTSSGTFSITAAGIGCTSAAGTGTAAPKAVPQVPVIAVVSNCGNSKLSTTSTGTLLWSTGGSTSSVTVTASGTYSVTVTNGVGCMATGSASVTVKNIPIATAASNSPLCPGGTLNLSSGGGTSYSWTGPNGFSSTAQNPTINGAATSAAGTYSVGVTNSCGTTSATATVTFNSAPSLPSASSSGVICSGTTLSLAASAGAGSAPFTYFWTGPNAFTSTAQNPTISSATSAAAGTYSVTVSNSCGTTSTAASATVNSSPSLPSATEDSAICSGTTLSLSSSAGAGITPFSFVWTGPNSFTSTAQNPTIVAATNAAAGTYTVTISNYCGATSTVMLATVNSAPSLPSASGDSTTCSGTVLNLTSFTGAGSQPSAYFWTGPNSFTSTDQNPTISAATTAATGTYSVTASNSCGSTSSTTLVTINVPPSMPVAQAGPSPVQSGLLSSGGTGPICSGTTLWLTSSTGAGSLPFSYSWLGPNNFTSSDQNPIINAAPTAANGTYLVTTSNFCGSTSTAVSAVVNASPNAIASSNSPLCSGGELNLYSSGGLSYLWSGPNTFSSAQQSLAITNVNPTESGTYTVTVTAANGCTTSVSIVVSVGACNITLNLKMFIQGYYQHLGSATPMDNLGAGGCLYVSGVSSNPAEVDTITMSLMNPATQSQVGSSIKGILHTDGSVWKNGSSGIVLPGSVEGNSYYIKITHRNAIETWSGNPVLFNSVTTYDFSTSESQAYGSNMVLVGNNVPKKYAFWSGDVYNAITGIKYTQDGAIESGDISIFEKDYAAVLFGYWDTDITGDGVVESADNSLIGENYSIVIFKATPW